MLLRHHPRELPQRIDLRLQHMLPLHQHAAVGRADPQAAVAAADAFGATLQQQGFVVPECVNSPNFSDDEPLLNTRIVCFAAASSVCIVVLV